MQLSAHESAVRQIVGPELFRRALDYARDGAVGALQVDDAGEVLSGQVHGTGPHPYQTRTYLTHDQGGRLVDFLGVCTCPVGADCKHSVALMLCAQPAAPDPWAVSPEWPHQSWDRRLESVLRRADHADVDELPPAALLFDVHDAGDERTVTVRPVQRGAKGNWVRTGISWTNLDQVRYRAPRHHRLFAELSALYGAHTGYEYYYRRPADLSLAAFDSARLWDVLFEADAAGVPFVRPNARDAPVRLHSAAVSVVLDVTADDFGLVVASRLRAGGADAPADGVVVTGTPGHGLVWADRTGLHLARLDASRVDVRQLLALDAVRVPQHDVADFLDSWAVQLQHTVALTSSDDSVPLPRFGTPELVLALRYTPGRLELDWTWRYRSGRGDVVFGLGTPPGTGPLRDGTAERTLAAAALAACSELPQLLDGPELAPLATLTGPPVVAFAERVRPRLEAIDGVRVEPVDGPLDLRAARAEPEIEFHAGAVENVRTAIRAARAAPDARDADGDSDDGDVDGTDRDWLDLAVTVRVDDTDVPFAELFRAIAAGDPVMFLPDGLWFELDRPEFAELAQLIAESRTLYDAEPGTVRVGRYHPGVWDELNRLGTISGQVGRWQESVRGLVAAGGIADDEVGSADGSSRDATAAEGSPAEGHRQRRRRRCRLCRPG